MATRDQLGSVSIADDIGDGDPIIAGRIGPDFDERVECMGELGIGTCNCDLCSDRALERDRECTGLNDMLADVGGDERGYDE